MTSSAIRAAQSWIVSMIGSRQHYAPPRALERRGLLRRFYTDLWCGRGRSILARAPGAARRYAGRFHPEVPARKVTAFNLHGLVDLAAYEFHKRTTAAHRRDFFVDEGERFARRVARDLRVNGLDRERGVFFGFKTASLETIEMLGGSQFVTVLDQMDPAAVEWELVAAEHAKWSGWADPPAPLPESLLRRWHEEWRLADVVFANSEWTRSALAKQGVAAEKIAVGPLAFEPRDPVTTRKARDCSQPLRILFVGSVILRKGIQYLIEAAKGLDASRFLFQMVGSIGISQKGLDAAGRNMRFLGLRPRDEVVRFYRDADVYVLPTLSDGFAITQIEAMAHGLPVIATPNCGAVVSHEADGLIVPAGDAQALRTALDRLERNRDEVAAMSCAALRKSREFGLDSYADRMLAAVGTCLAARHR